VLRAVARSTHTPAHSHGSPAPVPVLFFFLSGRDVPQLVTYPALRAGFSGSDAQLHGPHCAARSVRNGGGGAFAAVQSPGSLHFHTHIHVNMHTADNTNHQHQHQLVVGSRRCCVATSLHDGSHDRWGQEPQR